jgi:hypothetical protein
MIIFPWTLRPLYIYLLIVNFYVFFTSLGLWFNIIISPYGTVFQFPIYKEAFRVGLMALLGISLAIPREKETDRFLITFEREKIPENHVLVYFLLLSVLFLNLLQWGYAWVHKDLFFKQYILSLSGARPMWEHTFIGIIDLIIFILLLTYVVYINDWHKKKIFWLILLVYFVFKARIGGRWAMADVTFLLFWRYYIERKTGWIDKAYVKFFCMLAAVFILGLIALKREGRLEVYYDTGSYLTPLVMLSKEFINCSFSLLYSVYYISRDAGPPLIWPLFDPVISLLPSFMFPGREDLFFFKNWFKAIGGLRNFSPMGGTFLPGQIYLFTGSLVAVGIFFFLLARMYHYLSMKLLHRPRKLDQMQGLIGLSVLTIAGVRADYWIFMKYILMGLILVPFGILIFAEIFLSAGKNKIMGVSA